MEYLHNHKNFKKINEDSGPMTNDMTWGDSLLGRLVNSTVRKINIQHKYKKIENIVESIEDQLDNLLYLSKINEDHKDLFYFSKIVTLLSHLEQNIYKDKDKSILIYYIDAILDNLKKLDADNLKKYDFIKADKNNKKSLEEKLKEFKEFLNNMDEEEIDGNEEDEEEGEEGEKGTDVVKSKKGEEDKDERGKNIGLIKKANLTPEEVKDLAVDVINKYIRSDVSLTKKNNLPDFKNKRNLENILVQNRKDLIELVNEFKTKNVETKVNISFSKKSENINPDNSKHSMKKLSSGEKGDYNEDSVKNEVVIELYHNYIDKFKDRIDVEKIKKLSLDELAKKYKNIFRRYHTRNSLSFSNNENDVIINIWLFAEIIYKRDLEVYARKKLDRFYISMTKIMNEFRKVNEYNSNIFKYSEFISEKNNNDKTTIKSWWEEKMLKMKDFDAWVLNKTEMEKIENLIKETKENEINSIEFDPIIQIVKLFNKAYKFYTVNRIPTGRGGGRVSQKTFKEYEYIGKGSYTGSPDSPGNGPFRNIKIFNKFESRVMDIISRDKYKPLFSEGTSIIFNDKEIKNAGKTLLKFINGLLNGGEQLYRGGAQFKFIQEYFNLSKEKIPREEFEDEETEELAEKVDTTKEFKKVSSFDPIIRSFWIVEDSNKTPYFLWIQSKDKNNVWFKLTEKQIGRIGGYLENANVNYKPGDYGKDLEVNKKEIYFGKAPTENIKKNNKLKIDLLELINNKKTEKNINIKEVFVLKGRDGKIYNLPSNINSSYGNNDKNNYKNIKTKL